jgi:hypothetical protein
MSEKTPGATPDTRHLFPDDDTLGLPSWCPRGKTPWPRDSGHHWVRARTLAMTAWSLTAAGRRYVAAHYRSLLDPRTTDIDPHLMAEVRAYGDRARPKRAGAQAPEPAPPRVSLRHIAQVDPSYSRSFRLDVVIAAITAEDPDTASDVVLGHIHAGARKLISPTDMSLCLRASFACGLRWTTEAPPTWWNDVLKIIRYNNNLSHLCNHLPPAFFPRDVRVQWLEQMQDMRRALDLLYYPGSGLDEIEAFARRQPQFADAHALVEHLRHRHDLDALTPDQVPLFLGHANPVLAAFGLECATRADMGHPAATHAPPRRAVR